MSRGFFKKNKKGDEKMFIIKALYSREEGYREIATLGTEEVAREWVRAIKRYYSPIDVYYIYQ